MRHTLARARSWEPTLVPVNSQGDRARSLGPRWPKAPALVRNGSQLRKVVARESEARRRDKLSAINRELDAMSDLEPERGLASSLGFDHDQRNVANRILRERYAGSEAGVALWIVAMAAGAGLIALLE